MVLIAPFMVQPSGRNADHLSFGVVWASHSLIIPTPDYKFTWHIFGQIVSKSLSVQPYLETKFHNKQFMTRYSKKVPYYVNGFYLYSFIIG
jgi:hypothetical protein